MVWFVAFGLVVFLLNNLLFLFTGIGLYDCLLCLCGSWLLTWCGCFAILWIYWLLQLIAVCWLFCSLLRIGLVV